MRTEQQLRHELDQSSFLLGQAIELPGPSPSQQAMQRERAVILAAALDKLPDDHREVIILRELEGLTLRNGSETTSSFNRAGSSFNRAGVAPRVGKNLPRPVGHAVKREDRDAEVISESSLSEIGRRLDRSEDSVRKLWARAVLKMRHLMGEGR